MRAQTDYYSTYIFTRYAAVSAVLIIKQFISLPHHIYRAHSEETSIQLERRRFARARVLRRYTAPFDLVKIRHFRRQSRMRVR